MVQLSQRRGFCGDLKVSPYAADHNLLPHLQNIHRDGTQCSSVSPYRKTCPRPPVRDRETITTSNRKSAAHFPGSEGWVFPWQWAAILAESPLHSKTWQGFPHDIVRYTYPRLGGWSQLWTENLWIPFLCHFNDGYCCNDDNTCILSSHIK